jgi:CRP/FNR family transcriptional regulator, dissimilatory nitrate respiration regulator
MPDLRPDSLAAHLLRVLPASRVTRQWFDRGSAVFRQEDKVSAIYVVESGRIRLARVLADGTAVVLQVAEAGQSFAEAALSAARYHCDATAELDSAVLRLPKQDLLAALAADPAESLALTLALASQVRDLRARLELRDIRAAKERVLAWLHLRASGKPPKVTVSRSWTLIAGELGLSREAVYRALGALEREGRIARSAGQVRLLVAMTE